MAVLCLGKNNYDIRMESFVGLEGKEETLVDFRGLRLIGRERFLNGSLFISIDMANDILIFTRFFTFENIGWVQSLYSLNGVPFCEFVENFLLPYADPAYAITNLPNTSSSYCPLSKGEYWIINGMTNTDKWVSYMKRGLIRLTLQFFKDGKSVGGLEIVGNIIDRIS
ncbi:uncharacterized protein LOC124459737 [Drosophila willistoni]|uniref:uncharacterized protein LOC124459737 n=1 Tax=Drosophila willistoni TaxID=7260 RepID=UPI001F07A0E9|nr:uncharacterized protein LOC124459737 [Drosophila willistoni]